MNVQIHKQNPIAIYAYQFFIIIFKKGLSQFMYFQDINNMHSNLVFTDNIYS